MRKLKILIIDDEPDIRDILKIVLTQENYEVIEACDGEVGLDLAKTKSPDLIIVDYKMPHLDGRQVCIELKKDILLRHLPIIMLTGKGELTDKVKGLDAGADDYIVKPFEPQELLARIRMSLRRSQQDLDANPLTHLPGNISILNELQAMLDKNQPFAVCYLDLDKFKSYNDKHGFEHGDDVIKETARILIRSLQEINRPGDFIGHIGGDDFVIITLPSAVDILCKKIIDGFEKIVSSFYNPEDRKKGYTIAFDRQGKKRKIPLLSISIGVVTNEHRKINHVAEIGEIGAELKSQAKKLERSNYIKDQRIN
ncbi:MAG: response regulator [Candidatus Omnitrophota bacterium]